jgi:hypothetical protein
MGGKTLKSKKLIQSFWLSEDFSSVIQFYRKKENFLKMRYFYFNEF